MGGHMNIGVAVQFQRPGGDADRVAAGRVPEQARAALGAESAAGAGVAVRAVDPAEAALFDEYEVFAPSGGARGEMAVPPAALLAVTDQDVAKVAV